MPSTPPRIRDGLQPGVVVPLADGRTWAFPAPPDDAAALGPDYRGLLRCIAEAQDRAEARRAELALAIFLMRNAYGLGPDTLRPLLRFAPGSPELSAAQDGFHRVAEAHLAAAYPTPAPAHSPAGPSLTSWLAGWFRPRSRRRGGADLPEMAA